MELLVLGSSCYKGTLMAVAGVSGESTSASTVVVADGSRALLRIARAKAVDVRYVALSRDHGSNRWLR